MTTHETKTLAVQFRRGGRRETRYFYTMPTIHDVLNEFETAETDMGVDSLAWLETVLLPGIAREFPDVDSMPCSWEARHGDWRLHTLCD